jgi:hypothetical protein
MGITSEKYWISTLIFPVLSLLMTLPALIPTRSAICAAPAGVTLISCDQSGAVIEVNLPELKFSTLQRQDRSFTDLDAPGWPRLSEEGKPALPSNAVLLAIPPGAKASLAVEAIDVYTLSAPDPLPAPTVSVNLPGTQVDNRFLPDPAVYTASTSWPPSWASLSEPVQMRTYWAIPVRLTPVRATPSQGQVQVAKKLRLRITFQGGRTGHFITDPYGEPLARATLLNFQQARSWQEKSVSSLKTLDSQSYGKYKIYVNNDGLRIITHDDLVAAGISPDTLATLNPATLKLQVKARQGQIDTLIQVPAWVEGEWDGRFDPQDYILFFGNFARGQYTYENPFVRANTYWLDWGGSPGMRLQTKTATPSTAVPVAKFRTHTRVEYDTLYEKFGFANEIGADTIDHWLWHRLDSQFNPNLTFLQWMPGHLVLPGYNYSLTVSVRGYTLDSLIYPDHPFSVTWNDHLAIDDTMDQQNPRIVTAVIPPEWVSAPENAPAEITVHAPPVPGMILGNSFYLDWIRVDYWRNLSVIGDTLLFQKPQDMAPLGEFRYQLTGLQEQDTSDIEVWNLTRNLRLRGFTLNGGTLTFQDSSLTDSTVYYLAARNRWLPPDSIVRDEPSDWRSVAHHYDYLIITYEDFYAAMSPLVDHYASQGMDVALIKLGDVYDEFNYGLKSPQAIYEFIQYAFFNYPGGPPAYCLLVGDASWDYKNYEYLPYIDYCPTFHFWTRKWGETASDNFFVAVSGNDVVPDLYVGRMPVNTVDELDLMIQKSLTYAQAPQGNWRSTVIFSNGAIDSASAVEFDGYVDMWVENYFPPWYEPTLLYKNPSAGHEQYQSTNEELIRAINQGAMCVNYQGHAGNQIWETMTLEGIASLTNGIKLPFVMGYSCFTGIFSNTRGFGEAFILQPGGGAVAYFSNGAVGYSGTNAIMDSCMLRQLFMPPDTTQPVTFGLAMTQAKVSYFAHLFYQQSVVETFVLLGDPACQSVYQTPNPADTLDDEAPQIHIAFNGEGGPGFRDGDFVNNPVQFTCMVSDCTTIDTTSLYLKLTHLADAEGSPLTDSLSWSWWPNTPYPPGFSSTSPDTQHFNMTYTDSLAEGEWQFIVRVSDFFNNGPASDTVVFNLSQGTLALENALNWPNPFQDRTSFAFDLLFSHDAEVTIKIFTVAGRLVRILQDQAQPGYNLVEWDGRDSRGDPLSNGVYLYKIIAHTADQQAEKIGKLAKLK